MGRSKKEQVPTTFLPAVTKRAGTKVDSDVQQGQPFGVSVPSTIKPIRWSQKWLSGSKVV